MTPAGPEPGDVCAEEEGRPGGVWNLLSKSCPCASKTCLYLLLQYVTLSWVCLPFLRETLGTKARRGPEAPPSEVSSPPWVEQKSSRIGSLKKLESAKTDT